MRVGLDISPLDQTGAGTARYVEALQARLDVDRRDLRPLRLGGLATIVRDASWYPLGLPSQAKRGRLDLLTARRFAARCDDRLPARHHRSRSRGAPPSGCLQLLDALLQPDLRPPRRASRDAGDRDLRVHEGRGRRAASRLSRSHHGRSRRHRRRRRQTGLRPGATTSSRCDPRTEEEPRAGAEGRGEAKDGAPHRRRAGLGNVDASGWIGRVSDLELARLYRGAACVVYPSLYEGFGLPIAEAMACGVPVVTSRGGATEETAGGAAVLVDPLDVAAIASGIEKAIGRRDELRRLGLERAQAFSWEETARATVEVYREVAA